MQISTNRALTLRVFVEILPESGETCYAALSLEQKGSALYPPFLSTPYSIELLSALFCASQ
jgi:hypothetical protein